MLFDKIQLDTNEKVLVTVRKHWFIIVAELIGVVLAAVAPFLLYGLFQATTTTLGMDGTGIGINANVLLFAFSAWLLLSVLSGFTIWTHYYLDLWLVTDRRIISVDQIHFFNRSVAIFRLERMQDIEYKITGLIATFLNFGTISAQTAGHHDHNFLATGMPDPRGLQATIQAAMDTRLHELHIKPDQSE